MKKLFLIPLLFALNIAAQDVKPLNQKLDRKTVEQMEEVVNKLRSDIENAIAKSNELLIKSLKSIESIDSEKFFQECQSNPFSKTCLDYKAKIDTHQKLEFLINQQLQPQLERQNTKLKIELEQRFGTQKVEEFKRYLERQQQAQQQQNRQ